MLTLEELWQRIEQMKGQTFPTVDQGKPNKVIQVDDSFVEIKNRPTRLNRYDIVKVYRELHRKRKMTSEDLFLLHVVNGTGRIIMALLAAAVPEEIIGIPRSKNQKLCGIWLQ